MAEGDLPFVPVMPERPSRRPPPWAMFFGERARNTVYGWSERAFETPHMRRKVFSWTVHILNDPDAVQRVLLDNAANYQKPKIVKQLIAPLVGRGLLAADGEHWRGQRRIVAPTFAPGAVAGMTPLIARVAERQAASWPKGAARLDMAAEATRATMAIIAEALFSGDPRLTTDEASAHISAALSAAAAARLAAMVRLPLLSLQPSLRRGHRGRRFLRGTLEAIVRERGPGGGADDFLGGMIRSLVERYPAEEAMALAVDNAATFYLAGHETTANALAWTMYLLGAQPDAQERARAEAVAALQSGADDAGLPERLPWLRQVLDEALRLYPPAPRFDREAVGEDALCGDRVEPGHIVSIWPWLIHRQRGWWDTPDSFMPERFAPEAKARLHRFQYIPFGAGPRVCVGAPFATVEALVILAQWLSVRRFVPAPGSAVYPSGSVTLRPRGGVWMDAAPL